MGQMNLTPLDDVLDKHFEKLVLRNDALRVTWTKLLHAYHLEKAVKNTRIEQNKPFD